MKLWTRFAMVSMMALAIPACAEQTGSGTDTQDEGDAKSDEVKAGDNSGDAKSENTGEAEQAITCEWNLIDHYTYSDSTGTYKWDVSWNLSTGKWYVDERRIGGGFYKQYVLTPDWTVCPSSNETIALKNGGITLTGPHDCLPDLREEVHLQDKQRVLTRAATFQEWYCAPL